MQLTVIQLKPQGAFHFGNHGIGMETSVEFCPSDSLYAALLWEQIQRDHVTWEQSAPDIAPKPPFQVSSCLPYMGDVPLLPVPLLPPLPHIEQNIGERKTFKKIRFVSPSIFRALLDGGSLRDFLPSSNTRGNGLLLQGGSVLLARADEVAANLSRIERRSDGDIRLWIHDKIPHVTVGRVNNASRYYETGEVRFAAGCGLAVLAKGNQSTIDELMRQLHMLGESGLGGRRSKGLGQFTPVVLTTLELPDPTSERVVLLSRYLPSTSELQAEVLGPMASYQLVDVGGWLYSPSAPAQRRKPVRLLSEGSVVQRLGKNPPVGAVHNVAPDYAPFPHPVWRYGLALTVGVPGEDIWRISH